MKSPILSVRLLGLVVMMTVFARAEAPTGAEAILGLYWSPKKDAKVEIYQKGDRYFGKFVWVKTEGKKDEHNPDPKLQSRLLLNLVFLNDFRYKDGKYIDGRLYDPKSGNTYQGSMWMEGKNLKMRGFVGISALGRTELFVRIP